MFQFTDTKKISDNGAWVHLKNGHRPAYLTDDKGEPDHDKPVRIKILGPDSTILQGKARKRIAARIKARGGSVDLSRMSQTEIEAFLESNSGADAEGWVDATIGWENIPGADGKPLEFSEDNVEWLYKTYPAILRQIRAEAGDIDAFLDLAGQS